MQRAAHSTGARERASIGGGGELSPAVKRSSWTERRRSLLVTSRRRKAQILKSNDSQSGAERATIRYERPGCSGFRVAWAEGWR